MNSVCNLQVPWIPCECPALIVFLDKIIHCGPSFIKRTNVFDCEQVGNQNVTGRQFNTESGWALVDVLYGRHETARGFSWHKRFNENPSFGLTDYASFPGISRDNERMSRLNYSSIFFSRSRKCSVIILPFDSTISKLR